MATSLGDTSGTVGQTIMDVMSIIEHATRRCGVDPARLTAENVLSARDNLFLILSGWATRGLSLWCVSRITLGLQAGVSEYTLPVGTVDVLNALLRRATSHVATTTGPGSATVTFTEPIAVGSVLVRPDTAGAYLLALEKSEDGIIWSRVGLSPVVYDGSTDVGLDATKKASALYWRVVDLTDPLRAFAAATFYSAQNDIPMSKLSRDDYANLPSNMTQSLWPLQYWYDKQFYQPKIVFWPVPTQDMPIRLFTQSQVQDPGQFVNAVQVPQRWLDATISALAPRLALELPKELVPPGRYEIVQGLANTAFREAEDSETDGAPIRLAPNISYYTR